MARHRLHWNFPALCEDVARRGEKRDSSAIYIKGEKRANFDTFNSVILGSKYVIFQISKLI